MNKQWKLKFSFKILTKISTDASVLRLATNEDDSNTHGSRIVAFFLRANTQDFKTFAEIGKDYNSLQCMTTRFPLNQISNVEIKQEFSDGQYIMTVIINDKICTQVANSLPQIYENVKVYISDKHHEPANGFLEDFEFSNIGKTLNVANLLIECSSLTSDIK